MSLSTKIFMDLTPEQQKSVVFRARSWYNDHKSHIDRIVDIKTKTTIPSMEDCLLGPQVWRPEHWAWFLDSIITV